MCPMIRITTQSGDGGRVVVTIDGCLLDADVEQVRAFRKKVGNDVCLNLGGLDMCMPEGIGELKAWLDAGARLNEATPYQRMLLQRSSAQ